MEFIRLSEPIKIKKISEKDNIGVFEIEALYAGYGLTIGNTLRRALLSSLPGAVITQVKIKGIKHEFSTIPGILEDVIELTLNLKKIRFKIFTNEPQELTLKAKGEGKIKASDIKVNANVEVVTPDAHIATLTDKKAELEMELVVEKGLGYVPAESKKKEKLAIGTVNLDAYFSPIRNVSYSIENMRVGERTDYNRLRMTIQTDGSIMPSAALRKASRILIDHFEKISQIAPPEEPFKEKKEIVKGRKEKVEKPKKRTRKNKK